MLKFLAAFAAFFVLATAAPAESMFVADKGRTLYLRGEVRENALVLASQVAELSQSSKRPITIVINSPGGSIHAGLQLMSAIHVAQQRGTQVRCFVPVLAASMAFQILSVCDERYTLQYSLLLFHPARVFLFGPYMADDLAYQSDQLRLVEDRLKNDLAARIGLDRKEFDYHYSHETLWLAADLNKVTGNYFEIVDNFSGVDRAFDLEDAPAGE